MYESRIYIYNRIEHEGRLAPWIYGEKIACFEMCGMPQGFTDIFTEEKDFPIYADDGNTEITEDEYGAPLRACGVEKLTAWLAAEVKKDNYRRLRPLLQFLKALKPDEWDELIAVHYGY